MDSLATSQPFIDDDAIGRILKTSNKLRLLDVRGCSKITDSSLVRIPAWDLEHLYLSGMSYSYFLCIISNSDNQL